MNKILYTIGETATLLKASEAEIDKLIENGRLRALKLNVLKISKYEILRYIQTSKITT